MIRREAHEETEAKPEDLGLPGEAIAETVDLDGASIELLVLAFADQSDGGQDREDAALAWVAAAGGDAPPVPVPLYGIHVIWSPRRAAILAPASRVAVVREALLDFARSEASLRRLEQEAGALLRHVDDDAACAVELDERHRDREPALAERFRRSVAIRAALANLAPTLLLPSQHPPTLAAQLGERLRERTRVADRLEFVQAKSDVLDRVYDLCAQRVGDVAVARRHLRLEWVIVVLLAVEFVIHLVEVLATVGASPAS